MNGWNLTVPVWGWREAVVAERVNDKCANARNGDWLFAWSMRCWKALDREGLQDKKFSLAANGIFDNSPADWFVFIAGDLFVLVGDRTMSFSLETS